jgi:hypothetical protein
MDSRLLLLLTLSLLPACGKKGGDDQPIIPSAMVAPHTTAEFFDGYFASRYFIADPACQSSVSGGGKIDHANVSVWRDGKVAQTNLSFPTAQARPALSSKGISLALYGLYQQTDCGSATDASQCQSTPPVSLVAASTPLNICDTNREFVRTSVEAVALTGLAMLESASVFYRKVDGHSSDLPEASLLVLPKVETLYQDGATRSEAVDNLSYVPNFSGSPTFVIFPKGAFSVSMGRWVDVNLWEIPWTLAHEFGHHIFRFHSDIAAAASGIAGAVPVHSFPTAPDSNTGFALTAASGTRHIGDADLLAAVNEGFADLYAYYVQGSVPGMTKGIDCFHENRDAGIALFADAQPKVLSAAVLAQFMSTTKASPNIDCSVPFYQDIHVIGAIFAYGVDQIFSASVGQDAAKKTALMLDWAKRIGQDYLPTQGTASANLTFGTFAHAALATIANGSTLPVAACDAAKKVFPTYSDAWLSGEFTCK